MNGLQDLIDKWNAVGNGTVVSRILVGSSGPEGQRLEHRSGSHQKSRKCLIATESTRYGLVDLPCRSKARFQQMWTSEHHELRCRHSQEFVHQGRVERQRRHVPRDSNAM